MRGKRGVGYVQARALTRVVACAQLETCVVVKMRIGNLQDGLQRGLVSNHVFNSSIGGVQDWLTLSPSPQGKFLERMFW